MRTINSVRKRLSLILLTLYQTTIRLVVTRPFQYACFFVCALTSSCSSVDERNWGKLETIYASDSLKSKAVSYLQRQFDSRYSFKLEFYDSDESIIDIRMDTITNEESLKQIIEHYNLKYRSVRVADKDVISIDDIEKNITDAFSTKQRYRWSEAVSDSMFIHYVLPYKISAEYPKEWRKFFTKKYDDILDSLNRNGIHCVEDVTKFIVEDLESWYDFDPANVLNSQFPDLDELLYSSKGECFRVAYLYSYALRAAGIPSVVDIVPLWGSKNAGHAEYVSLDSTGRLSSNVATLHKNVLERAAKVFRLTFENSGYFTDSVKPYIGSFPFLIDFIKKDHILDVTDEHANAIDFRYQMPHKYQQIPFAYICIFNYGRWVPVFWGKNAGGTVLFPKMNTDILYRIGIPNQNGLTLLEDPFFLDVSGHAQPASINHSRETSMLLTKTNSGERSFLDTTATYMLQYLGNSGNWVDIQSEKPRIDSAVYFASVPSGGFYRLVKYDGDKRLERPFLWKNDRQEWW